MKQGSPLAPRRLLAAVAILALAFGAGCGRKDSVEKVPRPIAVRVAGLDQRSLRDKLAYVGTVHARREVRVIARVLGTVAALPVPEGASIAVGSTVALIDAPDIEASVERLRAERDYWCERNETDERLAAAGALPGEQATLSLKACRSARAALAEGEARLERTRELSPIDGRVLAWLVESGENVMPGHPLLDLGSEALEIHVEIVEEDLHRGIQSGLPVEIRGGDGREIVTSVAEVAPMAKGASRTFTVKLPVPPADAKGLLVGTSVGVEFIIASCDECFSVPTRAIGRDEEGTYIFEIRESRAIQHRVETGLSADGFVEVSLPRGDISAVAVSNLGSLVDGAPVYAVAAEGASR